MHETIQHIHAYILRMYVHTHVHRVHTIYRSVLQAYPFIHVTRDREEIGSREEVQVRLLGVNNLVNSFTLHNMESWLIAVHRVHTDLRTASWSETLNTINWQYIHTDIRICILYICTFLIDQRPYVMLASTNDGTCYLHNIQPPTQDPNLPLLRINLL